MDYLLETYHMEPAEGMEVRTLIEVILPAIASELKLGKEWTYRELYLTMLEATAKMCRVQKYRIYTLKELQHEVNRRLYRLVGDPVPAFVQIISKDILI